MTPYRILIVDDDSGARECYGKLFRRNGYDPCLAASGAWVEENREQLRDVELILLDYRMPGMTGLELLGRLRQAGFRGLAFLISAHVSEEMFSEAERLGIRRIFHKPVESAALLQSVAEAFTQFQREAERADFDSTALI
jgi:DNA-binding NtrC family response regulator